MGGKTAIDLPGGKNLVGAFKQPVAVLCDLDTLDTLPKMFLADGMGEVIKYGMIRDEKLFELLLTKEQIGHILAVLRKHQIPMVLEGPNYIYVDEKDFADDPYVIYLRNELGENLKSITGTAQYEVNKLSAELGNADVELVRKELGTEFDMIVHEPDGILEIGQAGHSKASGIERLCASLGIAKEDTYAFGDSANDVEMLEFVAHGIAMGNGTDVAKNAAEFVTTDIHKDGIWNGLKHYGLI